VSGCDQLITVRQSWGDQILQIPRDLAWHTTCIQAWHSNDCMSESTNANVASGPIAACDIVGTHVTRIPVAGRRAEAFALRVGASSSAPKSKAAWKVQIEQAYRSGKNANLALSRMVYEGTRDLSYGEWASLWTGDDRPFAVRKAFDLAFVGEHVTSLVRPDQAEASLPSALTTLYTLAQLPEKVLLELVATGQIHRKLKGKQAEAQQVSPQPASARRALNVRPVIARIGKYVKAITEDATNADGAYAMKQIQAIIARTLVDISQPQISLD